MMKKRIISTFLICIILVCICQEAFAQNASQAGGESFIHIMPDFQENIITAIQDVTIYTMSGIPITAYVRGEELTANEIADIREEVSESNPNVQEISVPTTHYNCHSYAWYIQSIYNTYWVNNPAKFIMDPHCTELDEPIPGCIVTYNKLVPQTGQTFIVHSGVVLYVEGNDITVVSKWGKRGLYEHELEDVLAEYTYNGVVVDVNYYTYTREHSCRLYTFNDYTHTGTCTICNTSFTEVHTPNALGTRCTKCLYTGPFAARSLILEEEPVNE